MHENPRATEEEQEAAQEGTRQQEEDAMRYPGHDDPDAQRDVAHREDGE
jgi:hypothetical protein